MWKGKRHYLFEGKKEHSFDSFRIMLPIEHFLVSWNGQIPIWHSVGKKLGPFYAPFLQEGFEIGIWKHGWFSPESTFGLFVIGREGTKERKPVCSLVLARVTRFGERFLWAVFWKLQKYVANNFGYFYSSEKKLFIKFGNRWVGLRFWAIFSQTHPVTLVLALAVMWASFSNHYYKWVYFWHKFLTQNLPCNCKI
jgi:hypothetical protein